VDQDAVQELIDRGVEQGCVDLSEVDDLIQRLGLDERQEASLLSALDERGIEVRDDCGRAETRPTQYVNGQLAEATGDALSQLLREAGDHPLLTHEQEVELFKRIERGDRAARDHMVASNIRLVVSIARRYQGQGLPLVDLIQEGVLGLMRAIDKFEWERGYKFSTYATWWIRQALQRGLASRSREIRMPLHVAEREQRISRLQQEMSVELGRPPRDEEISERSGIALRYIEELRAAARAVTSLDRPTGAAGEEGTTLGQLMASEQPGPEESVTLRLAQDALDEAVDALPEPERQVVRLRYGIDGKEPMTLSGVARELGITLSRVRKLESDGLSHLAVMREVRALRDVA
jgi:RNA polymerase primary sigma factor